ATPRRSTIVRNTMSRGATYSSPIRNAAINAPCEMLTFLPASAWTGRQRRSRIRALPFFCFSSSFFLRVMPWPPERGDRRPRRRASPSFASVGAGYALRGHVLAQRGDGLAGDQAALSEAKGRSV